MALTRNYIHPLENKEKDYAKIRESLWQKK